MTSRILSSVRTRTVAAAPSVALRTAATAPAPRTFTTLARSSLLRTAAAPLLRSAVPVRRFADEAKAETEAKTEGAAATNGAAADANATPAVDPKVAELQAEVAKKDAALKELQEKYQRALAEQLNVHTRSQKQVADAKQFAVQGFAKSLLEVADVLEIATKAAEPHAASSTDENFKNLYEGMRMTQNLLLQTFARNGLAKFEPLGEKFDPHFHDGIMQMEDASKTPGTVGVVLKSGYKLHERCLRAAQVGTVKAPAKQ